MASLMLIAFESPVSRARSAYASAFPEHAGRPSRAGGHVPDHAAQDHVDLVADPRRQEAHVGHGVKVRIRAPGAEVIEARPLRALAEIETGRRLDAFLLAEREGKREAQQGAAAVSGVPLVGRDLQEGRVGALAAPAGDSRDVAPERELRREAGTASGRENPGRGRIRWSESICSPMNDDSPAP